MLNRVAVALALLPLAACGPEKQTTTDATTTTNPTATSETTTPTAPTSSTSDIPVTSGGDPGIPATCPDRPQTDACCCFEAIPEPDYGILTGTTSACGLQPLCPLMEFECLSESTHCDDMTTKNAAAIDCSLQALADGKGGEISYYIIASGSYIARYVELDLVGDGTLFRQGYYREDLDYENYAVTRVPLPGSTYFTDCLALEGWRPRFDCLRAAPFADPLETCIDGRPFDWDWCTNTDFDTC